MQSKRCSKEKGEGGERKEGTHLWSFTCHAETHFLRDLLIYSPTQTILPPTTKDPCYLPAAATTHVHAGDGFRIL